MPRSLLQALADRVLYRGGYFRMVDATSTRSAEAMATSIAEAFAPRRVIDYGCGTGSLLASLQAEGIAVAGTEYSALARSYCRAKGIEVIPLDLREPSATPPLGTADVAVSLEVAEHLPETAASGFVRLLASTAPIVVFGAATPGQGGQGHVNEQPHAYWIGRFASLGMPFDDRLSLGFRDAWRLAGVDSWYADNAMVFRRLPSHSEGGKQG